MKKIKITAGPYTFVAKLETEAAPKTCAAFEKALPLFALDAIDLVVHLQKLTGKKIKPEEFKSVRSVNDVVDAVERLLAGA